jgi:hypothetical protein
MDQWTNGGTIKRMGTSVQPLKKPIAKNREKIAQKNSGLILFHLGDRSTEEHLKNTKTTRNVYLGLGQSIYIKK